MESNGEEVVSRNLQGPGPARREPLLVDLTVLSPTISSGISQCTPASLTRNLDSRASSSSCLPNQPPTPASNFDICPPDLSSGSDSGGEYDEEGRFPRRRTPPLCNGEDEDDEDIFPPHCGVAENLRDIARRRMSSAASGSSSWDAIGDNGSIHSSVVRRRRQLLEGRPEENGPKDVVMCVLWGAGKFAATYYDLETAELFILPDIADSSNDFIILRSVVNQVNPTYVIVNKSSDDRFLKVMHELTSQRLPTRPEHDGASRENMETDQASAGGPPHLYALLSKEFVPDVCKQRVQSLKLPFEPKHTSPQEHLMFITSLVPFANENMIRTMGCLLKFLDKSAIELFQIEVVGGQVPVVDIKLFKLDDMVLVDETAWNSLQIVSTELHPSSFKHGSSSGSKEGLSVYGLINHCTTIQGAKALRLMLLRPTRNVEVLERRYDVISFCMNPNQSEFVNSVVDCLKSIKSIPKLLYRMSLLHATVNEWRDLYQTLYHCLLLGEICTSLDSPPQLIKDLNNQKHLWVLRNLTQEILRIVDFEESVTTGRIVAREGLDPLLDKKKRQYSHLPEIMSIVASEEIADLPLYVNQCCVVYMPEVGYLLAVSLWRENLMDEELPITGLEFRFRTHELAYYKSPRMRELDVIVGDCSVAILERETMIMVLLSETILEQSNALLQLGNLVSELDCLVAMSKVSAASNFVRPVIVTTGKKLKIIGGKHPISDLMCEFVPNSTTFADQEKVVILTGPNASGKSVYLKQVGVIVVMALSGCFVPADFAQIPAYDRICTRIHVTESVSTGYSSFMVDMNQMSLAIRSGGGNSLVIIDEFGKGTSDVDGLSMLVASIQDFIDRNDDCPTIFLSTHYFSLINLLKPSPLVKFQTMKFLADNNSGLITFLHQLENGYCDSSFARFVAKAQGLPQHVMERAQELELVTRGSGQTEITRIVSPVQNKREDLMIALADEFLCMNFDEVNPRICFQRINTITRMIATIDGYESPTVTVTTSGSGTTNNT